MQCHPTITPRTSLLFLHQHRMIRFNLFPELFRYGVPDEQVDSERQVAFLERFPEIGNTGLLARRGEYHQIQVGLRACRPFDAGAVDPSRGVRQVSFE